VNNDLEQRLLTLGAALEVPPAPDLAATLPSLLRDRRAATVRARLIPSAVRPRRALALALAAILLLAGAAMAVTATRHAILRVLGLRGVQIERVPTLPRVPPSPAGRGARLGLGARIPFADARHAAQFTALLPARPVPVYLAQDVPGGRISMLIGPAMVTEFRGSSFPVVYKLVGQGTRLRQLRFDGGPAVYLTGAPHEVLFQTADGSVQSDRVRLAGNVLLWQHGPVTVRIEGTHSLAQALKVARSVASGAAR
jgi:hypothetical protein